MYKKEFELAKKIVKLAYKKNIKNKVYDINVKNDDTVVTNCDINTENYLIDEIKKHFPLDNFLTEENNSKNKLQERTWVIDPIDGTSNFCNHSKVWGIQLAFVDNYETKFSVMYFPMLKEFYSCMKGNGVYLNNKKLVLDTNQKLSNKALAFFMGEFNKYNNERCEVLTHVSKFINSLRYAGCASITYALMCKGVSSLIVSYNTNHAWDELPGDLMCKELGVKFVDCGKFMGKPLKIYTVIGEISDYFSNFN